MSFRWRKGAALMYPNDFGDGFFRLPKYVVSFNDSNITHYVNYGDGKCIEVELATSYTTATSTTTDRVLA